MICMSVSEFEARGNELARGERKPGIMADVTGVK